MGFVNFIDSLGYVTLWFIWSFNRLVQVREGKVKALTPREAGYAIQLSNKTLLDVRPSTEHKKVHSLMFFFPFSVVFFVMILELISSVPLFYRHGLKDQPGFRYLTLVMNSTLELFPESS